MKRLLPLLAVLVAVACSEPDQQPVITTSTSLTTTLATTTTTTSPTSTRPDRTTTTTEPLGEFESLRYRPIADLAFPVQLLARVGSDLAYVVLKGGQIMALDTRTGEMRADPVLDITGKVRDAGEQGLLAMALHPTDTERFFVHYSARGDGRTVLAEYRFSDETTADPDSESILFEIGQPAGNHNGGMILFDPDGALLLALGDGGGADDIFGHGQNANTLLGGLVALDVEGSTEPSLYAMGLRNPWRFWIDEGLIYVADVGQSAYEEVSVAPLGPGVNYGWPITEGLHCFRPASECDVSGLHLPVIEVAHGDAGTCSITGGVVYRGEEIPEIQGRYFYSDYCGSYLRSFRYQDGAAAEETDWTGQVGRADGGVVGFGVDGHGEMYVATTRALLRVEAVRAE